MKLIFIFSSEIQNELSFASKTILHGFIFVKFFLLLFSSSSDFALALTLPPGGIPKSQQDNVVMIPRLNIYGLTNLCLRHYARQRKPFLREMKMLQQS